MHFYKNKSFSYAHRSCYPEHSFVNKTHCYLNIIQYKYASAARDVELFENIASPSKYVGTA